MNYIDTYIIVKRTVVDCEKSIYDVERAENISHNFHTIIVIQNKYLQQIFNIAWPDHKDWNQDY